MKIKSQIHKILVKINVLTKALNFCIRIYSNRKRRGCEMKRPGEWYTLEEHKLKIEYYCIKCYQTIETMIIDITKLDPYEEKEVREIRVYTCMCGEIYSFSL
jgi:hypothetical protein